MKNKCKSCRVDNVLLLPTYSFFGLEIKNMIGAIAGDIIGSVYEWRNIKTKEFPLFSEKSRFTDDTVLTVALADSILNEAPYVDKLKEYFHDFPRAGYGGNFYKWEITEQFVKQYL